MKVYDLVIVVPYGLSAGVVRSQVFDKFSHYAEGKALWFRSDGFYCPDEYPYDRASGYLALFKILRNCRNVYTRSVFDFFRVYLLSRMQLFFPVVIFDVRGLVAEESLLRNGSLSKYRILKLFELLSVRLASRVTTVSFALANYLKTKYGRDNVRVVPCCVPNSIRRHKQCNYKKKRYVFIYVGSVSLWQGFERACELFASIKDYAQLIVVTNDKESAELVLSRHGVAADIRGGGWDVVCAALDESDFGFILRDESLINVTASPVKFAEYVSRGVVPIMTQYVGDYSGCFGDCALLVGDNDKAMELWDLDRIYSQKTFDTLYVKSANYTWEHYKNQSF